MNTETRNATAEEIEQNQERPEKADYIRRINELPAEDQAFMDGFLFAKVTSRRQTASA